MQLISDVLIFLLIGVPLIGGGIWYHGPHFKLELTELAVPVIAVFAIGALLQRRRSVAAQPIWLESRITRKSIEAFERWKIFVFAKPVFAIGYGTVFVSLLWAFASLRRHWALESNGFDLGIFTNTIWNLTHGNGYMSSVKGGINLFVDHQSPVFWALAPVFAIFPSPDTLLVVQAIALALGAGAVFALGRQYRREMTLLGAALPLLYWTNFPIRQANLFDFHPEVLMLPLFLWALVGIQSRTQVARILGWVAFVAALGCKESAGPVAVGVGVAWLVGAGPEGKPWRLRGWVAVFLGLAVFAFDLHEVPKLLGGHYTYDSLYSHLSAGAQEWVHSLVGPARLKFLFATLAPLAFFPLLAPREFFAAIPGFLMLFLSAGDSRLNLKFHYAIEPSIGLFWALAATTRQIPEFLPAPLRKPQALGLWITFWALVTFGRSEVYWIRHFEPSAHETWLRDRVAQCLQSSTTLTASGPLVPQMATRRWIQQVPDLGTPPNDCIWVDESLNNWPLGSDMFKKWEAGLPALGYQLFFHCGPTNIYQRQNFEGACLRCMPECPESGTFTPNFK